MANVALKGTAKRLLLELAPFFNDSFAYTARMALCCSRGSLNVATRRLDPARATSWEFSAFSQNGEDGLVDHLLSLIAEPNRYFIEVGAADGLENNSSYLAFVKKFDGIMVEGDAAKSGRARRFLQEHNLSVKYLTMFLEPHNVAQLVAEAAHPDPDFFSLDIDGNDFHVVEACLAAGLRPKVLCVEYNSAFGPDQALTVPYTPGLDYLTAHPSMVYYGASVRAWRALLERHGYRFVTVESRGVNAFFVDSGQVALPSGVAGLDFAENGWHGRRLGGGWRTQFALISDLPYVTVPARRP